MKAQLELYFPKGLNLRKEDIVARRMSVEYSAGLGRSLPRLEKEEGRRTRWSRLDHFIHKPTKFDELMDAARLLLKAKREEERDNERY